MFSLDKKFRNVAVGATMLGLAGCDEPPTGMCKDSQAVTVDAGRLAAYAESARIFQGFPGPARLAEIAGGCDEEVVAHAITLTRHPSAKNSLMALYRAMGGSVEEKPQTSESAE